MLAQDLSVKMLMIVLVKMLMIILVKMSMTKINTVIK